jgi:hypothetical protein
MKSDASHSINMLKLKFDEIKRNINTIEQKQKEFFSQGIADTKGFERIQRPASVNRFSETKPKDTDRLENLMRVIKDLESERQQLYKKNDEFRRENEKINEIVQSQDTKIKILKMENQELKLKLEKYETQEKRPQSCMRDAKSPPKKNRVAFSKDLISVHHINENSPLTKNMSKGSRTSLLYSSPTQNKGTTNQYMYYTTDGTHQGNIISKQKRIGLD